MKTEKRFYVVSFNDEVFEEGNKFDGLMPRDLSDEDFKTLAEDSGRVYLLDGLIEAFNLGEVYSKLEYIRVFDMPIYEDTAVHEQTINVVELASDLAHNAMVVDGNRDYTEEAQDVFNRWYDYFYNHALECVV